MEAFSIHLDASKAHLYLSIFQHVVSGREYNGIIISWAIDVSECGFEGESACIGKHKHDAYLRAVVAPTARGLVLINDQQEAQAVIEPIHSSHPPALRTNENFNGVLMCVTPPACSVGNQP